MKVVVAIENYYYVESSMCDDGMIVAGMEWNDRR